MTSDKEFTGQKYGYVRVSTDDQTDRMQRDALIEFGVPENQIFSDTMTGATMNRPQLAKVLKYCRKGDMLVIWRLDRLGRSVVGMAQLVEQLNHDGIQLRSITDHIDTTTPNGRFVMNIMSNMAQYERELIAERTKAGVAAKMKTGWRPGPKHGIRDYPKRHARFAELLMSGDLAKMTGRQVIEEMNRVDPKAPKIKSPQMLSNWKRENFKGLELQDPPLEEGDG